jgi:hypothetical protein
MSNIVDFPGITTVDLAPDRVLQAAIDVKLKTAIVIGYTENGDEYLATSTASGPTVLWLLERVRHAMMTEADR